MQFDSLNAVAFTLAFLVPGFVWSAVLSMLVPRRAKQAEVRFLELFTLSCLNNALWLAVFVFFASSGYFSQKPGVVAVWIFIALFVSPVVLGLISGAAAQKEFSSRFLRSLGFRTVHYVRSAWDWHFSRQQPLWIVVTLKDG